MRISKILSRYTGDTVEAFIAQFNSNNVISVCYSSKDLIEMSNIYTLIDDLSAADQPRSYWKTRLLYNEDGYFTDVSVNVIVNSKHTTALEALYTCIDELREYPILSLSDYASRKYARQLSHIQKATKLSEKDAKVVWNAMFNSNFSGLDDKNGYISNEDINSFHSQCFKDLHH